jgi:predicted LPLAT superfamily acyltransferase
LHQKIFLTKLLVGVSVKFLFRKNQSEAIFVFGRHFDLFSNQLFFPKTINIFELKTIYSMEKSLFSDFCQNFENLKKKTRHLGLWRHFERFSKTVFYKILVLLGTTEHARVF